MSTPLVSNIEHTSLWSLEANEKIILNQSGFCKHFNKQKCWEEKGFEKNIIFADSVLVVFIHSLVLGNAAWGFAAPTH